MVVCTFSAQLDTVSAWLGGGPGYLYNCFILIFVLAYRLKKCMRFEAEHIFVSSMVFHVIWCHLHALNLASTVVDHAAARAFSFCMHTPMAVAHVLW